jgi:predicted AAA+ superfamily ATPase
MGYVRLQVAEIEQGFRSEKPLLQVVMGPRQVGKSTAAEHVIKSLSWPAIFESADSARAHPPEWIENQWERARILGKNENALLVLDEIQKIPGWSEVVKRLWDKECREKGPVRVLLLGSSALPVQKGLSESLAGRFMLHRFTHWSWDECRNAFGWSLEQWLFFGGYPGAAAFVDNERTWKRYVNDSLIETVLARDILQLEIVHKPALLRQLFALAAGYPAQIFSYNKMLGQLVDAGNTTTLAHYLDLLERAFLVSGLEMFSKGKPRRRGSSPKLVLWNNALVNAFSTKTFQQTQADSTQWGRLVENAVGAKLLNELQGTAWKISYWREGPEELDYVITHGNDTWGIEVKSGRESRIPGLAAFKSVYPSAKIRLIGSSGIPLEEFFDRTAEEWFQ